MCVLAIWCYVGVVLSYETDDQVFTKGFTIVIHDTHTDYHNSHSPGLYVTLLSVYEGDQHI